MENQQALKQLIDGSFRMQKVIFYGMGIVAALVGVAILILSVTVPPAPGEENILRIMQVVAAIFILFGFWSVWYVRRRIGSIHRLVFVAPEEVSEVRGFKASRRGVTAYALRFYTSTGQMVGLNVSGPRAQEALLQLLKERLPDAKVGV